MYAGVTFIVDTVYIIFLNIYCLTVVAYTTVDIAACRFFKFSNFWSCV